MEKNMLKRRLVTVILALMVLIATGSVSVFASENEVVFNGNDNIGIYVNGIEIIPKDANGKVVSPFILNGTTYLPVRAVGEAFSKIVSWNSDEKAVIIGNAPAEIIKNTGIVKSINGYNGTKDLVLQYVSIKIYIDGAMIDPKDATGENVEPFIIDGTTYLPVRAVGEAFNMPVSWNNDTRTVHVGEDKKEPAQVETSWSNPIQFGAEGTFETNAENGNAKYGIMVTKSLRGQEAFETMNPLNEYTKEEISLYTYVEVLITANTVQDFEKIFDKDISLYKNNEIRYGRTSISTNENGWTPVAPNQWVLTIRHYAQNESNSNPNLISFGNDDIGGPVWFSLY